MRTALKPEDFAPFEQIVRSEVIRIGYVPGFDQDDLRQEALVAVSRALAVHDSSRNGGRALVRTAVRNALIKVKRKAMTQGRMPQDHNGRRLRFGVRSLNESQEEDGSTLLDVLRNDERGPEEEAAARELVRALYDRLSQQQMSLLVAVLVKGAKVGRDRARGTSLHAEALESIRVIAKDALLRMLGRNGRRMLRDDEHRVDHPMEDVSMTKKKIKLPQVDVNEVECHALSPTGPGYDPTDPTCHSKCPDKFTCLRDLIENPAKNARGLTLDSDTEVKAVLAGELSYEDAKARMKKRIPLVDSGAVIPDHLSWTKPLTSEEEEEIEEEIEEGIEEEEIEEGIEEEEIEEEIEEEEIEEEEIEEEEADDSEEESDGEEEAEDDETEAEGEGEEDDEEESAENEETMTEPKKKGAKKAAKKSTPKKATKKASAKKAAPKKKEKKSKGRARIPKEKRVAIYSEGKHRYLPQPRELDADQMAKALSRVKLGQPFELAIGMEIVRKRRDGGEVVVKIAKNGFVMDGVTYPSLSAAGQWASKRAVSGNDFFNVETYSCTEIRGEGVPGGVYSKQGEGKAAIVGAHGNAKKKAPAKKTAKKAPVKKTAKKKKKSAKKS